MELRHLRYFVAVAEELHFRRAAERLHMSQPPLSAQIRALEQEVGAQLLERNRRRVELTVAGEVMLEEARAILYAVDHAAERARRAGRGEAGRLAVGLSGSAMYTMLPEILRAFRERYPEVLLELRELSTGPQLDALAKGTIDVGALRPPLGDSELATETILREDVLVALPERHPLAQRERLALAELGGEPVVLLARREAPGLHALVNVALTEAGAPPRIVQEAAAMQTVVGLVAAGMGVSLVPASIAAIDRPGVAYRPLAGAAPTVELALAWRPGARSPVLDAFLGVVREHARLDGTPA